MVVESKCQKTAEFDKYKLYVDELDKVMILLLKLSGRLARAQNAVLSLPEDASEKHKVRIHNKSIIQMSLSFGFLWEDNFHIKKIQTREQICSDMS